MEILLAIYFGIGFIIATFVAIAISTYLKTGKSGNVKVDENFDMLTKMLSKNALVAGFTFIVLYVFVAWPLTVRFKTNKE